MFKFNDKSGKIVFSDEELKKVEEKAKKYKKENQLKSLEIVTKEGKFVKWI